MFSKQFRNKALVFTMLVLLGKMGYNQTISEQHKKIDAVYGYNPHIYKGAKYMAEHRQQFGHPFFQKEQAFIGKVIAKNYSLDSVQLWYDVYKHYLVYGYNNHIGSQQKIILNAGEVNRFILGSLHFVHNKYDNISSDYIQEVFADSVSCYINYRKDYKHISNNTKKGFGYTEATRKMYLVYNDIAYHINSQKALLKILPESIQQNVKQFMATQGIRPSKANEAKLALLFEFINTQLN